ncbi:MAG TPA: TonB-dependent receptor [Steroidobacteraceae bacterium]|nr:TonB-dependent receptor [Steroidobacteraceae bacterium]
MSRRPSRKHLSRTISSIPQPPRRKSAALMRGLPLASAIFACLHPAQAADETAGSTATLEEVVVTAQKRSESLQDVPLSISVLGTQKLEELNVRGIDDYIHYLPSVSYQDYGPGSAKLYMRGVSSGGDGVHSGSPPSVGVYLDEQPVTTIQGMLNLHMYDIERVEALAGPQGTLYGASSEAGTLRIITNKPELNTFKGAYDVQANDVSHGGVGYSGEGFVNIPIGSIAAFRLVGWYQKDAGYIDNVPGSITYPATYADGSPGPGYTESNRPPPANPAPNTRYFGTAKNNYNGVETYGARAALKIALGDNWTITPTVQGQEENGHGTFAEEQTRSVPGYPNLYTPLGDLQVQHFAPESAQDHWVQTTLTVQGKISDFDVTYAGGFVHRTSVLQSDYTDYSMGYALAYMRGPTYFADNAGNEINPTQEITDSDNYRMYSHEVRVSTPKELPVRATLGGFTQRQTDDFLQNYAIAGLAAAESVTNWPGTYYLTDEVLIKRDNAVFGEVTWDATSHISLLGGLRYYNYRNSEQGYSGFQSAQAKCLDQNLPTPYGAPCQQLFQIASGSGTTPKGTITYKFDSQRLIYATVSKGFRPGGPNTIGGQYQSDFLKNYEFGWKTSWLGNTLRVNGAIFQEDWQNFQFSYPGLYGIIETKNAGGARIRGIESSVDWAASSALTFSAGISWLDPKLTVPYCNFSGPTGNVQTSSCFDYSGATPVPEPYAAPKGQQLPTTPKFKGNVTGRYSFALNSEWQAYTQGSLVYQTAVWSDLRTAQRDIIGQQPSYALVDTNIGAARGPYNFELYVDNLFDRRAQNYRYAECNALLCGQEAVYAVVQRPRTVGVKFSQKF